MSSEPVPGKPAPRASLCNIPKLVSAFYALEPDPAEAEQRVSFGTSGHRGSSLKRAFNERHIWAIAQAVSEHRRSAGVNGPLFLGIDTHALSEPALAATLEVFAAHGVETLIDEADGYTPTPVISHAILSHNQREPGRLADGVVLTPSHNPPEDGGFKYNPTHGGPADTDVTDLIQKRANELLENGQAGLRRIPYTRARRAACIRRHDFKTPYVAALSEVIDMQVIQGAGVKLGVDPLGGASVEYWARIQEHYGLDLDVVNDNIDPTFAFMPVDHDGKIRMDCSSAYAMANLIGYRERYDVAFGNDTDADRHGIVTKSSGLLNPNHFLAVAIDYLFKARPEWNASAGIGKTLVSSSMIDRVAAELGRPLHEVPVGFKWFVEGLRSGALGFAGEESAGASLLKRDGSAWTTDKDGIALALLAAEITASTGADPGTHYRGLEERFGVHVYARIDAPATVQQKAVLKNLSPTQLAADELAGDPLESVTTTASNGAKLGGLKVTTQRGWFAARPSGTENAYKIYAESFVGDEHLKAIQEQAQKLVDRALSEAV